MLGNHLGAIALSGMIAEMVAILRYEMGEISPTDERRVSNKDFESWGQSRRVDLLKKLGYVPPMECQWFELLRETRRKYLHWFSTEEPDPAGDALKCYRFACGLVSWVIGDRYNRPGMELNPALWDWLEHKGLLSDDAPTQ